MKTKGNNVPPEDQLHLPNPDGCNLRALHLSLAHSFRVVARQAERVEKTPDSVMVVHTRRVPTKHPTSVVWSKRAGQRPGRELRRGEREEGVGGVALVPARDGVGSRGMYVQSDEAQRIRAKWFGRR